MIAESDSRTPGGFPLPTLALGVLVIGPTALFAIIGLQALMFFGLSSPGGASGPLTQGLGRPASASAGLMAPTRASQTVDPTRASQTATSAAHPTEPVGPEELVSVKGIRVHASIAADVTELLAHAQADGVELSGWGWRDTKVQIRLRRQNCGTSDYAINRMPSSQCSPPTARPGRSQHERGLAIDFTYFEQSISTRRSPGYIWLSQHAHAYGLKNLPSEPWHWSTTGR